MNNNSANKKYYYDSGKIVSSMHDEFKNLFEFKFILKRMIYTNFKTRYKRSFLGIIWSMLNPLLNMLVFMFIFSYLFHQDVDHFPIYILAGQMIWAFFSQSTSEAMNQMIGNAGLISKIYLPKSIYILSGIGINGINLVLTFILLLLISALNKIAPSFSMLLIIPDILIMTLFTIGISMITATIVPFLNDFSQIWGVLLSLWMYASAIFYPISIIDPKLIPLFNLNPIFIYISIFRDVFINNNLSTSQFWLLGTAYGIVFFLLGWWIFTKHTNEFAYRI